MKVANATKYWNRRALDLESVSAYPGMFEFPVIVHHRDDLTTGAKRVDFMTEEAWAVFVKEHTIDRVELPLRKKVELEWKPQEGSTTRMSASAGLGILFEVFSGGLELEGKKRKSTTWLLKLHSWNECILTGRGTLTGVKAWAQSLLRHTGILEMGRESRKSLILCQLDSGAIFTSIPFGQGYRRMGAMLTKPRKSSCR